ncbi:MAG: hydroxypyruvate isomerase [Desulfofustis sp.]|jgi:hydroxypyruvate isomerase|nr:hydroxypyruvate isomerase [Desulfofustis sp.]
MPKFSANLTMLFTEVDFVERFGKAAENGFSAVEFMFPYGWPAEQLRGLLDANNLEQVLFNLPVDEWAAGVRGIACLPGREQEFQENVERALAYATVLQCPRLNCLAGLTPADADPEAVLETLVTNLRFAADALAEANITLLVEALNSRDIPGFHLVGSQAAVKLIDAVDRDNVRFQYDIYHMQRMEGELINTVTSLMNRIGHIQLADNPGRHEPGTGEINFTNLFKAIDAAGYDGWIGCEYIPAEDTKAGLGWMSDYR